MAVNNGNSKDYGLSLTFKVDSSGINKLLSDIKTIKDAISGIQLSPDDLTKNINIIKEFVNSINDLKNKLKGFNESDITRSAGELKKQLDDMSNRIDILKKENANIKIDFSPVLNAISSLRNDIISRTIGVPAQSNNPVVDTTNLDSSINKLNNTISKAPSDIRNSFINSIFDSKIKKLSGFEKFDFAVSGNTDFAKAFSSAIGNEAKERKALTEFVKKVSVTRNLNYGEDVIKLIVENFYKKLKDYSTSPLFSSDEYIKRGNIEKNTRISGKSFSVDLADIISKFYSDFYNYQGLFEPQLIP